MTRRIATREVVSTILLSVLAVLAFILVQFGPAALVVAAAAFAVAGLLTRYKWRDLRGAFR